MKDDAADARDAPRIRFPRSLISWAPALSVLVAATGVLVGVIFHSQRLQLEEQLKRYETITIRRDAYVDFAGYIEASFREAMTGEWSGMEAQHSELEKAFMRAEAFLDRSTRDRLRSDLYRFEVFCKDVWNAKHAGNMPVNTLREFVRQRERMKAGFRSALFE